MGLCCAKPIEKVKNSYPLDDNDSEVKRQNSMSFGELSSPRNMYDIPKGSVKLESAPEIQSEHKYFSFISYLQKNASPQIKNWRFFELIGNGSISHIYKVINIDTHIFGAARVYHKALLNRSTYGDEPAPLESLNHAIQILKDSKSKYTLPLLDIIDDDITNSLILIIPLAKIGPLSAVSSLETFSEDFIKKFIFQIGTALNYLHHSNIVHNYICPHSILVVDENHFFLQKLQSSIILQNESQYIEKSRCQFPYSAPETLLDQPFDGKIADIWSLGLMAYSMVFHILPFGLDEIDETNIDQNTLYQIIISTDLVMPNSDKISHELLQIIEGLLQKDPSQRLSLERVLSSPIFHSFRI